MADLGEVTKAECLYDMLLHGRGLLIRGIRTEQMLSVSAPDDKQRLAALLNTAQREPVMIRCQNRDVAVILSQQEYDRLRAPNTDEFQRFCDRIGERAASRGMTEEKLAEILADESQGAVIDTNALVSRLLLPGSIPGQTVRKAVAEAQLLASDDSIIECFTRIA